MVKTILLFYYSTINNNTEILNSNSSNTSELSYHDFIDWLVGFTDGDGSFSIVKQGKTTFTFVYSIYLHKDDTPLLINIQKRLCMGKVYEGKHFSSFNITKKKKRKLENWFLYLKIIHLTQVKILIFRVGLKPLNYTLIKLA